MGKGLDFLTFVGIVLAVSFASCSNEEIEGPIGPRGPQGEQGIQGPEGLQGPAGEDGQSQENQSQDGSQGGGSVKGEQGEQGLQGESGVDGMDGEDGADGKDGQDGAPGQQGTDGQNGADGEDGNANVIASDWITADFENTPKKQSKHTFKISNKSLSKSLVLVYGKSKVSIPGVGNTSETTYMLPAEIGNDKYWFTLGKITTILNISQRDLEIRVKSIDGSDKLFLSIQEFQYFIVPANVTARKNARDFKKMSYQEVINHFGLDY